MTNNKEFKKRIDLGVNKMNKIERGRMVNFITEFKIFSEVISEKMGPTNINKVELFRIYKEQEQKWVNIRKFD